MSTIYDNPKNVEILKSEETASPEKNPSGFPSTDVNNPNTLPVSTQPMEVFNELQAYKQRSINALRVVDDIVLKNYLTKLSDMQIIPAEGQHMEDGIILYKVNKMAYEKDEYATEKFISVVSAMTYTDSSIFMIVDGHKDHTDFYLGVKCNDEKREMSSVADTFYNALMGQFPGAQLTDLSYIRPGASCAQQDLLLDRMATASSISTCSLIPAYKNSKGEYTNASFVQGIEKFATAMQGKEYTAVILASNTPVQEIANLRKGYEMIYTELATMATQQLAYSTNESLANALTRTKGESIANSLSETEGTSTSYTTSESSTSGTSRTHTEGKSESEQNVWSKLGGLSSPLVYAGAILTATGVGAPVGAAMMAVGGGLAIGSMVKGKQITNSSSDASSENQSETTGHSETNTKNESQTVGETNTKSDSTSISKTATIGSSKNFTITIQNKQIQEILKRIDQQLERIALCESTGLWSTGAYFLSFENDRATAETGATIFRSIMQGEQSGVEVSAINTWYDDKSSQKASSKELAAYVKCMEHPLFGYLSGDNGMMPVLPTSLLSSKELAMMLGLPRKSVPGLPVVEHVSLGKEVVRLGVKNSSHKFDLGAIFDQGIVRSENRVWLDTKSLTQHTFVTGSTGCGKSETVYKLIDSIRKTGAKFLIIEPAKGEYKNVFGTEYIYGTNPLTSNLLKINPFKFVKGVHVLEHADRLIEIFNVCWPMYAAMPAVLKEAVLNAYEDCGWDLLKSTNKYSEHLFPTFADLIQELEWVINTSAYSEEVKSNYKGSLVTRVKSLANGINGEIFSGQEIGDVKLFDENVIVDISRIGSQETKALIMGILIMRLNEYRSNSGIGANSELRHVTILEEAHNILKRCSQEQSMEGSNVAGKSVEMIANSIAEMRTYGEGFIIVDQSPGAVDISAIRNTNTKIIMRLPEETDRRIAGKSAAMKDHQIDEIAKLPTGVAVVYQNDWEEPVLCQIDRYEGNRLKYEFKNEIPACVEEKETKKNILKFLLKGRISGTVEFNKDCIVDNVDKLALSTFVKLNIFEALQEYDECGEISLWKDAQFEKLSRIVTDIMDARTAVRRLTKHTQTFDELTYGLEQIVAEKTEVTTELCNVIEQCLMRDYSLVDELHKKLYSAWLQHKRKLL